MSGKCQKCQNLSGPEIFVYLKFVGPKTLRSILNLRKTWNSSVALLSLTCFDLKSLNLKIFLSQKFFFDPYLFDQFSFVPYLYFRPKMFLTKFFRITNFLYMKFFWNLTFFGSRICLAPNSLGSKTFMILNIFALFILH